MINLFLSISLILIKYLDLNSPSLKNWAERGVCCMSIWMLLSLWSNAFIAKGDYKGKYSMDARPTKLFTFALVIIECMAIYYASFNHPEFLKLCCVSLIIWIVGFGTAAITNKKLIIRNHPSL